MLATQSALTEYLDTSPPDSQVAHLLDVLQLLTDADDQCSAEEKLAFDEVSGQINQYLLATDTVAACSVVAAAQDDQQDEAIRLMLKDVESHDYAGGKGYTVGSYFSSSYADIVCSEYRLLGFFTVVMNEPAANATLVGTDEGADALNSYA